MFVFPATSLATPAATETLMVPAVPPAPVLFVSVKLIAVIAAVVNDVVVIDQPVDSLFFVISEIVNPETLSLNVAVRATETDGVPGVAVRFPPEAVAEVRVTVGRTVSICTPVNAVEAAEVPPL